MVIPETMHESNIIGQGRLYLIIYVYTCMYVTTTNEQRSHEFKQGELGRFWGEGKEGGMI